MTPVVNRQDSRCPRLRKRGKPTGAPTRSPSRLSDQARSARARASRPELYASLLFSGHHGATSSFCRFHSRRSAASDQLSDSVSAPPSSRRSHSRASSVRLTSRSPKLKANRAAPQCEASARRCWTVGSSANRYAWCIFTPPAPPAARRSARPAPPLSAPSACRTGGRTTNCSEPYWRLGDAPFQLTPRDVMNDPGRYAEQYRRTLQADLTYPITVCDRAARQPMILDGVHRLLEAVLLGRTTIVANVFTLDLVPRIQPTHLPGEADHQFR